MKKKKILITCLFAVILILTGFTSCNNTTTLTNQQSHDDRINIVATTFPQYDWVRQILGDNLENVELTLLADSGIDLHNFQPSVSDMAKISDCDMFIYIGGESDAWVEDALKNATNDDMIVINLLDVLGDNVKEEEIIVGMESEDEHDDEDEHEHEGEVDEHVWLSLKNARLLCEFISNEIGKIDPENYDKYSTNTNEYNMVLSELDDKYEKMIGSATYDTLLFGDRFPFRYLVDDYGLNYHAAFPGCSAETEASFETIVFLANKLDELGLRSILVIDSDKNNSIAKTIIETAEMGERDIHVINSMQSITQADVDSGVSYISIMEDNLEVLKKALN